MEKKLFLTVFITSQTFIINTADLSITPAARLVEQLNRELLQAVQNPELHSHPDGKLRRLIERGADPSVRDGNDMTPLMHLVDLSNFPGVEELLSTCSDPSYLLSQTLNSGHNALTIAELTMCGGDSDEVLRVLRQYCKPAVESAKKAD